MSSTVASPLSSSATPGSRPSDQELVSKFQAMRQELQALLTKLSELEADRDEHAQVIDTIKPLDPERKAYRLVGGILMERTVREVLPALEKNVQGINDVMKQIAQTYAKKEAELKSFQDQYKIRIVQEPSRPNSP